MLRRLAPDHDRHELRCVDGRSSQSGGERPCRHRDHETPRETPLPYQLQHPERGQHRQRRHHRHEEASLLGREKPGDDEQQDAGPREQDRGTGAAAQKRGGREDEEERGEVLPSVERLRVGEQANRKE